MAVAEMVRTGLDFRAALTFIFISQKWGLKLLGAVLCVLVSWVPLLFMTFMFAGYSAAAGRVMQGGTLLFFLAFWLLFTIPALLFLGYTVATARGVKDGANELPQWKRLRPKLLDGFLFALVLVVWTLPLVLSNPGPPGAMPTRPPLPGYPQTSFVGLPFDGWSVLRLVWALLMAVLYPAIWSQYLQGSFIAAFNIKEIFRRVGVNGWLTFAMAVLGLALGIIGGLGLAAAGIGIALTLPLAALIQAHLIGQYARLTDPQESHPNVEESPLDNIGRGFIARLLIVLGVSFLLSFRPGTASAAPVVVEFEDLTTNGPGQPPDIIVGNQYASRRITFNNLVALDYSKGDAIQGFAHSGKKALEQCLTLVNPEFCFLPIEMTFSQPVPRVKVWVGYSAPLTERRTVELLGYDFDGNIVAAASATLNPSAAPQPIQIPLEASISFPNIFARIVRARVVFNPITISTAHLAIDDVEFDVPGVPACTANAATPTSGPAPLAVQFQAGASEGTPPYTFSWDFGDGALATGPTTSHTYGRPGAFTAALTVQDLIGNSCASARLTSRPRQSTTQRHRSCISSCQRMDKPSRRTSSAGSASLARS